MTLQRAARWIVGAVILAVPVAAVVAYWRSDNVCSEPSTGAPEHPIKAVTYCEYGPPEVLRIEEIEKPVPGPDQLLVRVRAAAINPLDWHYMRGSPYIARPAAMGWRRPAEIRLGVDYAGTVEAVGANVTRFKPGDEVFGGRTGALAEYITVRQDGGVVSKPTNITFEQAAGVPVAGLTALQALRDQGGVQPGQRVLINGASGGVGTFAVQIAKALGAHVTGVCSTRNVELVKSIGADEVIDYTQANFTEGGQRYDLIVDNVGNHPLWSVRRVLEPEGKYIMVGGPSGRWIDPLPRVLGAVALSSVVSQEMRMFISQMSQQDLALLSDLMAAGKVTPVIDRRYPLAQIREAIAYLETGRARGKVVIVMD